MKRLLRPSLLICVAGLLAILAFFAWYRGGQAPLSVAEQTYYLDRIARQEARVAQFLDIDKTREFLRSDDGRAFYVVNIFKFNSAANYSTDEPSAVSGQEAFTRFTRYILPLWLANGSHPVFSSSFDARIDGDWDFVSVVRYRSRRDFIAIQTSEEFIADALPHRFAATANNVRVKIAGNQVPALALIALLASILAWLLLINAARAALRVVRSTKQLA